VLLPCLTLSNLTVRDAFVDDNGGAILNDPGGTLVIANSRFISNGTSLAGSGEAIVTYGPLTITDSLDEVVRRQRRARWQPPSSSLTGK
jgi:hypothetical protein